MPPSRGVAGGHRCSARRYVHRLPLTILKIDRAFVAGLPQQEESLAIVKSVLSLAGALGLQTIGEGIETEAHANSLRQLGCHLGQGYWWSPALSAPDLVTFLTSPSATDGDGGAQRITAGH